MARVESLSVGDRVVFYGKICEVIRVTRGSEVITIRYTGEKSFAAYVYARDCRKI